MVVVEKKKNNKHCTTNRGFKQPKSLLATAAKVVDALLKPEALNWSIRDVSIWLRRLNLPQYRTTFKLNSITGRRLLLLTPKRLCQMNIHSYDHQMLILKSVRELFSIEMEKFYRSISLPQRYPETHIKLFNSQTGRINETMTRYEFFRNKMKILRQPAPELNHFEWLHQHLLKQQRGTNVGKQLFGGVRH